MNTLISFRRLRGTAAAAAVLALLSPTLASAASSWNPTLLVNTESFQTIDEGDGSTNVEIRFGGTLNETIQFNRTTNRFEISDDLGVRGNLSGSTLRVDGNADVWGNIAASGALKVGGNAKVRGNLSGASITVNNLLNCNTIDTDASGNFVCGTDSGGDLSQAGADARYVNTSGDTMTGALTISNNAGLNASGAILTNSNLTINSDAGATDAVLTFGNSTANQSITFLNSSQLFQFSKGINVNGNAKVRGNLSGSTLRVDGNADVWGNIAASGSLKIGGTTTLNGATKVRGNLSGTSLRIDNNADIWGALSTSGAIKTKSNLTINSDSDTNNAVLTFGNNTADKSITFNNSTQRFEFNDDIKTNGNLSGSTLTVDGNFTWHGQTYAGPTSQTANTFLKTDGAGNLTWATVTMPNGSGTMLSLHPEYPNAVYTASGANTVGQLSYSGALAGENYYRWTSTRGTLQNYLIAVRVQIPKNFSHFETASGVLVRLRTATTSAANNHVTVRILDTAGATVNVGNNASLVSSTANTWRTNTITGVTNGTFTPLGYMTVLIKVATTSSGITDLGYIDLRWSTTTP